MKKSGLDERQEWVAFRIGTYSFYVMFVVCMIVIIAELIWKGDLGNVLGETIIFVAGGGSFLIGCIKSGMWTKTGWKMSTLQNLLGGIIFSGIFTAFYAVALSRKLSGNVNITKYVILFFLGISVLCFVCLEILGRLAQSKKEKQERKYSE